MSKRNMPRPSSRLAPSICANLAIAAFASASPSGSDNVSPLRNRRSQRRLPTQVAPASSRSEEHTSELQSLMRISYAVFCLKKKKNNKYKTHQQEHPNITHRGEN